MTTFNLFGCQAAAVLRKFAMAGYIPTAADFGGDDAVADAMDDAAEEIVQAMPASILRAIQEPDLCVLVERCSEGQATAPVPAILLPIVAGSLHLWAGPPGAFVSRPVLATNPWPGSGGGWNVPGRIMPTPPGSLVEMAETDFTVGTDEVTLAQVRARNDQVLASWRVDVESEDYTVPSLAGLVAIGAAAELGAKVYPQASSQWDQVQRLADTFASGVAGLAKGDVVPPEVRILSWWKEPEPRQSGGMDSVRRFRA